MLFFCVLKGYIVWGSRRTYQTVKEALSCFLPIGPLPVSPGWPVSHWQQLLAACGGWGWAAQLQTSVGPGPPSSLFLFCTHTYTHTLEPTVYPAQRTTFIPSHTVYWWRGRLKLPSSHSFLPLLSPSTSPIVLWYSLPPQTLSPFSSLAKGCSSIQVTENHIITKHSELWLTRMTTRRRVTLHFWKHADLPLAFSSN